MKYLLLVAAIFLTGCSTTVPVTAKFPAVPEMLNEKCPQLKTVDGEQVSVIDLTKTITINYTAYYECAVKNEGWIEWYQKQKQIFEEIK